MRSWGKSGLRSIDGQSCHAPDHRWPSRIGQLAHRGAPQRHRKPPQCPSRPADGRSRTQYRCVSPVNMATLIITTPPPARCMLANPLRSAASSQQVQTRREVISNCSALDVNKCGSASSSEAHSVRSVRHGPWMFFAGHCPAQPSLQTNNAHSTWKSRSSRSLINRKTEQSILGSRARRAALPVGAMMLDRRKLPIVRANCASFLRSNFHLECAPVRLIACPGAGRIVTADAATALPRIG